MPWNSDSGEGPFYRRLIRSDLVSWRVVVGESDLGIGSEREDVPATTSFLRDVRAGIEDFSRSCPAFLVSLAPIEVRGEERAPDVVRAMLGAARIAAVGPFAAVAGAIAEAVARFVGRAQSEVLVENGGDAFLMSRRTRICAVYAGDSPLSLRIGIALGPEDLPCAVCTSSARVGPSLSLGAADAGVIVARSGALADAVATALCNRVATEDDLASAVTWAASRPGVTGALAILGDRLAVKGAVELVPLRG